jgi:hypothetical protein
MVVVVVPIQLLLLLVRLVAIVMMAIAIQQQLSVACCCCCWMWRSSASASASPEPRSDPMEAALRVVVDRFGHLLGGHANTLKYVKKNKIYMRKMYNSLFKRTNFSPPIDFAL